jgi:hypothetical protein
MGTVDANPQDRDVIDSLPRGTSMRTKLWSACAVALVATSNLVAASGLSAQPAPLTPGETVVVTWRDPAIIGASSPSSTRRVVVVGADPSGLIGRLGGRTYIIERSSVVRMRRRIGTRPATAPEMVAGSAIGFATGFLVGAMGATEDRVDLGLSTGVLLGAPVGALVAWAASRSRGIYEDVPFPDIRVRRAASSGRAHLDVLGRVGAP